MTSKISLLLPVLSLALLWAALTRPEFTGLVTGASGNVRGMDVLLETAEGTILPEDSVIEVSIGGQSRSMPVKAFISESGGAFELAEGANPDAGYVGPGYTGNHAYLVPAPAFNFSGFPRGVHPALVRVHYNGTVMASMERQLLI